MGTVFPRFRLDTRADGQSKLLISRKSKLSRAELEMQLGVILIFAAAAADSVFAPWDKWSQIERNGNQNVTYRQALKKFLLNP